MRWNGEVVSVQPRIRLLRSFDERYHSYLGYVLRLRGQLDGSHTEFSVAVTSKVQEKHQFGIETDASGIGSPVANPRTEIADLYKVKNLESEPGAPLSSEGPPFHGVPPPLPTYRERGHRRLSVRTYESHCTTCIWGCHMPVEIIVDHWKPNVKKYRRETFCYGPKSCPHYKPGPKRKVPGRRGMSWVEEDWVDEDATAHRGPDD